MAKKKSGAKTNAARILDGLGISYELKEYPVDLDDLSATHVAEMVGMPIEKVQELADGRIYTARQALKNGLIDDICSFEEAKENVEYELMKDEDYDSSIILEFEDFEYQYETRFMDIFGNIRSLITNPKAEFKLNYLAY